MTEHAKMMIEEYVEKLRKVYSTSNTSLLREITSQDKNFFTFGNGKDQISYSTEDLEGFIERELSTFDALDLLLDIQSYGTSGNIYWFATDGHIVAKIAGTQMSYYIRITGVLEHKDDQLWARQFHVSMAPGEYEELETMINGWLQRIESDPEIAEIYKNEKLKEYLTSAKELLERGR